MNAPALVEPIGVEKERIDPYTILLIDHLFPGQHGVAFLAAILRHAKVKQLALPEIGLDVTDVAVITVQSLRVLARLIGLSYDTTEKYVVIWNKLRLLHKERKRSQITLHFPLSGLSLPEPSLLEDLDYRPKVVSFAARVKARLTSLRNTLSAKESTFLTSEMNTLGKRGSVATLLSDIQSLLSEEVDSHVVSRLLPRIEQAIWGRLFPQKVDSFVDSASSPKSESTFLPKGDSGFSSHHSKSLLISQKGDSDSWTEIENRLESPFAFSKVDSFEPGILGQSLLFSQKGDSDHQEKTARKSESTFESQKVDSFEEVIDGKSRFFPQKGDSDSIFEKESTFENQKGDFQGAAIPKNVNDNDITILFNDLRENDNVNVHSDQSRLLEATHSKKEAGVVGRSLADFLDNGQNVGGYVEKCKKATPTQVRAAVIASLAHTHFPGVDPQNDKGRPKIKGAWFHDFCNQYLRGVPIQPYVRKWLLSDLSWREIDERLLAARGRYTRYLYLDEHSALMVRKWLWGEIEQEALEQALNLDEHQEMQETAVPVALPKPAKDWMSQEEAEALVAQIKQDAHRFAPKGVQSLPDDRGNFVVQLRLKGAPLTMKTRQAWQEYWTLNEPALIEWEGRNK